MLITVFQSRAARPKPGSDYRRTRQPVLRVSWLPYGQPLPTGIRTTSKWRRSNVPLPPGNIPRRRPGANKPLIGKTREWWARRGSNPRPIDYESTALTAELQALMTSEACYAQPAATSGRHCNNKEGKRHRHRADTGGVRRDAGNQFPSRNDFSLSERLG